MAPIDDNLDSLLGLLRRGRTFLLVPHERADGDALGSMLALAHALRGQGKNPVPVLLSEVSERYRFLLEEWALPIVGKTLPADQIAVPDAVILIDTGVRQQLGLILPFLDRRPCPLVVIDHHAHGDLPADLCGSDEASPATGLLVGRLLDRLGWLGDAKAAEYLLVALASDTGWFSYSNTTAECFAWAARLAALGADVRSIYERLFLSESAPRFRLVARALAGAELRAEDRVVVLTLRREDFRACGADEAHTENLVDQATRLKSMLVALLFVEQDNGVVRISLRSREPFDVHQFARQFGGGGHAHAAGMKVTGNLDTVKAAVLGTLESQLAK